jgi:23S rRNA (cytidine1920-2'-O)/16S rRNA (cytidine1409-2'-O)-methyltransferase
MDRLDRAMITRRLASSRERAQMLIRAGMVRVGGVIVRKPSQSVEQGDDIAITGEVLPYVGRGGLKMEAALKHFRINVRGARCLDIGASTGGFTDCLLQRGAALVVAVDVGHGQLHPSLRDDPRVESHEGLNARHITRGQFGDPFDFVAVDLSFISLTLVLPALAPLLRPGGHVVALIKPEFEAGREAVDDRGVVRDDEDRRRARDRVTQCATRDLGWEKRGMLPSPIVTGGNREYLACYRRPKEAEEA